MESKLSFELREAGVTLTLCHVKIMSTGQTGWILKNTIESNWTVNRRADR